MPTSLNTASLKVLVACERSGMVRAIATDGHRLGWIDTDIPSPKAMRIILRADLLNRLKPLANICLDAFFGFDAAANVCSISFGNTHIVSKLIDGVFPDCNKVMPNNDRVEVPVDTRKMMAAIGNITKGLPRKNTGEGIKISKPNGKFVLEYSSPETGTYIQEIEAGGEPLHKNFGVNIRYLEGIIKGLSGREIIFSLAKPGDGSEDDYEMSYFTGPTIIKSAGDPLNTLLMPLRI